MKESPKGYHMLKTVKKEQEDKEFEESLLENMNSLYNLAYRLTFNRDDAFDLVQEASLRAHRFYHKFEKGTNFKAWILTICRNIFINQYRKRVKEPSKVSYEAIEGFVAMPQTGGAIEEIFGENVQRSIDQLPEELKTATTLFYVDDFSYKEIAKIMNCPIGTVMSRLHMAKQLLKKSLVQYANKEV